MLAECSVSWGNLELICIGLRVSLQSWFKIWVGLEETGAEADTGTEKGAITEAEAGTGAMAVAFRRSILWIPCKLRTRSIWE